MSQGMGQDAPAPGTGPDGDVTAIRKTVASSTCQRSVYQVHQEFDQLDPAQIGAACTGWKAAADELLALADNLKARIAVPLEAAWSSPSSPEAQFHLRRAEETARALAADCLRMARATDYAANYAAWYKANLPSYTDAMATGVKGAVTGQGLTAGADAATEHLARLLGRYNEVIQILPAAVRSTLPRLDPGQDDRLTLEQTGPGGGSGATGAGFGSGSQGASRPRATRFVRDPGVGAAGGGSGGGSVVGPGPGGTVGDAAGQGAVVDPYLAQGSLAGTGLGGGVSGFDPSALGSAAGEGSGSAGGLGAGLGAGALGATGLGAGGLAAGLGTGRAGTGSGTGGAVGARGGGTDGMAGRIGSASGAGGSGAVPMHGGGGQGEGEEERQRSSWLAEDGDVWGTDGDVPPPVITR